VLADYAAATPVLARGSASRRDIAAKADIPANLVGGLQYTVVNDISFGSAGNRDNAGNTINVAGGTVGTICYLRGHNEGSDPSLWPELSNGTINVSAKSLIIRGLRLRNFRFVLKTGAKLVQVESNYISDFYENYQNGVVSHDGDQACDHILIAFNRYSDDVARISTCLLRVFGTGAGPGSGDAKLHHVTIFRNHIHGFQVGPQSADPSDGSGRARVIFTGDHDDDEFWNMHCLVQENLCTNWRSSGPFAETKYPGITFKSNTFEWGVISSINKEGRDVGKKTPLQIRIRHGRLTVDPATDIDSGQGAVIDGNLWVWTPASNSDGGGVNLRDGFHQVVNNWAVSLADGAQPVAGSTVLARGKFDVQPLSGRLDWNGYPANSTPGGGQNWPNGSKCKIGGNHTAVTVGEGDGNYATQFNPEKCRVAPANGARADQNAAVSIANQTNPDTGTVVGADFSKIPVRLRGGPDNGFGSTEYDVGPAAWAQSYYGN
jgi:hypothetical protein